MRSHAILFLALMAGLLSAFVPSDYFYANEGNVTVTYTNFTLNGTHYSIVYFNDQETFLIREGEIVNDSEIIKNVVRSYYRSAFLPSESELDEIRSLVTAYNASRNDGYGYYKNKEEYECRGALLTDKRIEIYINGTRQKLWCHDDASCEINAMLLYQAYGEGLGWSSYRVILQPLKDFAYSSYGTDEILENFTRMLNTDDAAELYNALNYMKNSIPTLESYATKIESTIFRLPRPDDAADKESCHLICYSICPPFDLNTTILDRLETRIDSIKAKIQPLAEYNTVAEHIITRTNERAAYRYTSMTISHYNNIFSPLETEGREVEEYAANAYSLVGNTSLMIKTEQLKALRESIRGKITNASFTGLDDEIRIYRATLSSVREGADSTYSLYNETMDAKRRVDAVLFELGTKDLSDPDLREYNEIREHVNELNLQFTKGITPEKCIELKNGYDAAEKDAQGLLKRVTMSAGTTAVDAFRMFSIRMNNGIADILRATKMAEVKSVPHNKLTFLGGFSILVFISFMSIAFLLFLYSVGMNRDSHLKYILSAGLMLVAILAAVFSGLLYYYMDKTATEATMDEFLFDLNKKSTVALVAKIDLATPGEAESIKRCMGIVANTIREKNKTVDVYYLESGNVCKKNNATYENCAADIESHNTAIIFSPSTTVEPPTLSTIFVSKAEIRGPADYYETCPLSVVFK
ncbi:MAG: hypothetical protein QXT45_02025 [Candidatus Bilamarchaeaceae archaeon]